MNWKATGKKIWKRTWQTAIVLFVMLCILEVAYRYQWIDFFKTEYQALNPKIDRKKPNVLVFGDSFTAHPKSYVDWLRKEHKGYNFINCAMPGSGPYEMELMAARRMEDHPPKAIIYQMYVGNDLTDIDPPTNWGELSFSRNMYWSTKQYFQIFGLFSRRLSGLQTDFDALDVKQGEAPFSAKNYSPRTKMMIRANSSYVQQCVQVQAPFRNALAEAKESIAYLREIVPKKVPIYIVIIPHFSQVTKAYNNRYEELSGSKTDLRSNYKLYRQIKKVKGVKVLNPMAYFREQEKAGKQLYFNNDPHLTNEGQQVLFTYLDGELKQLWK